MPEWRDSKTKLVCLYDRNIAPLVALNVVRIIVTALKESLKTYALLDSGSTNTVFA
jgi:hypothetical protein